MADRPSSLTTVASPSSLLDIDPPVISDDASLALAGGNARKEVVGALCLFASVAIAASQPSVYQRLHQLDPSVIEECAVLCASNAIGFVSLVPFYRKDLAWSKLRIVTLVQWIALFISTVLYAVVGPFLLFKALTTIEIAKASILQRFQVVLILVFSIALLNEKFSWWDASNAFLAVVGIVSTFACAPLFGQSVNLGVNETYVIISEVAYTLSLVITKKYLSDLPIGLLVVYRLGVGTILYHVYRGFSDGFTSGFLGLGMLFHIDLWSYMWWYGLLYAALLQVLWLKALVQAHSTVISIGTTVQFVLMLFWGMVIQQQFPTYPETVGVVILILSIVSGFVKEVHRGRQVKMETSTDGSLLAGCVGNFAAWDGLGCLPCHGICSKCSGLGCDQASLAER